MTKTSLTKAVLFGAALTFGGLAAGAATAQTRGPAAASVGQWVYDADGAIVGSVQAITDNGRSAVLHIGTIYTPGNHLVVVPADQVAMVGGHATLQTRTAQAIGARGGLN